MEPLKEFLTLVFQIYFWGVFIFAGFIVVVNPLTIMNKHQRGKSFKKAMKEKISLWSAFIWPAAIGTFLKSLKGHDNEEKKNR